MNSTVKLTRRVAFSAGHRFWDPRLDAQLNRKKFGAWASPFNHGHNYILDVTTEGVLDESHGMVVNIKVIDDILKAQVLRVFDFKSINDEVSGFDLTPPTLENLLPDIAARITPHLPAEATLTGLRLEELPTLWGEWTPEMTTLTRTYEFAASHRLHAPGLTDERNIQLFGKCNNFHGHGHNYLLEVTVTGDLDPETGMMVDLGSLDASVHAAVVDRYDHKNLNIDLPEFAALNTTSEQVAQVIFRTLQPVVPGRLVRVRLHETARNIFEVSA